MISQEKIITATTTLFAQSGTDGISMRAVAKKLGIAQSVLYYYFGSKEHLLTAMFASINTSLGKKRAILSPTCTAHEMLYQRIAFQFDHAEEIIAVLKYFIAYRSQFKKLPSGYVPEKGYLHIEEVLTFGVQQNEFKNIAISRQAKVITHAINGFLLEYFPHIPKKKERVALINEIHAFIYRGIIKV